VGYDADRFVYPPRPPEGIDVPGELGARDGDCDMPQRESLYHKYPGYRVDLEPEPERVRVRLGGEVLADSNSALLVKETKHEPVLYLPRDDVRLDLFEPTEHTTFCPFKGEASYWTLRLETRIEENVVWSYEDPFEEVSGLKDYMAFYPERVEWERGS
jgi:uncharacterized protein (DUF427 family)